MRRGRRRGDVFHPLQDCCLLVAAVEFSRDPRSCRPRAHVHALAQTGQMARSRQHRAAACHRLPSGRAGSYVHARQPFPGLGSDVGAADGIVVLGGATRTRSSEHMPRAIGSFRRVGFDVEPYPVDWRTRPRLRLSLSGRIGGGLASTDHAVREWLGLFAYRLTGRTSALLPRSASRAIIRSVPS